MLDKIIFFLYVARCGSFTEAAKQYGISASAGSRWVCELEESLGVSLLKRTTRKVILTQAGERLYKRFDSINEEVNDVLSEIQNIATETKGLIKIAATPLFAKYYLGTIIGEFLTQYPKVNFQVLETPFDVDLVDGVDFAIRAAVNFPGKIEKDSLLIKKTLFKEPIFTCCSPKYLEKQSTPKKPDDLVKHRCLFASTLVGGNRWVFKQKGDYRPIVLPRTVEVDDSEILRNIALAGGGIVYLPRSLMMRHIDNGEFIRILSDYDSGEFEFSLYYKPRKQMPSRCENFKNYLTERVPQIRDSLM